MPDQVKLAIVYYSSTGTVDGMARHAATVGGKHGAEVRLRHVAEHAPREVVEQDEAWRAHADEVAMEPIAEPDDVVWADAVLFGSPTRFGNVASQLKQFLDSLGPQWGDGVLADKVYAGFTAADTAHGGHESTLLALYNTVHHFGGILVAPGYTDPVKFDDGNPYGASLVRGGDGEAFDEAGRAAVEHLVGRVVDVTGRLLA
ncbi:NAD(P)H:quinone oxidoreductase type IV [Nocardioides guangzhouensis]|uniref:NAD(P)H:quinone oxidoreductase type IV n=1 Tax=Nocardioides guangzhouensis TaxID=2497878 RepID=A0A4Q4Z6P7_9ACTN|nr:NAD(P)H:quinone oxidoreductase type IV [Nocardioides guangzhouensis]RYP83402.1 NAD(P)H:quinone oxidoreductase type IV [Nocardioides guangzhouensis]